MKGKLFPNSQTVYTYTDVNDQDWKLVLDLTKGNIAAAPSDSSNMYQRDTSTALVRSDSFDHAGEAIDAWVDDWNAGKNPPPVLTVDAKPAGSMLPLLLLLAALMLLDGKGKRR